MDYGICGFVSTFNSFKRSLHCKNKFHFAKINSFEALWRLPWTARLTPWLGHGFLFCTSLNPQHPFLSDETPSPGCIPYVFFGRSWFNLGDFVGQCERGSMKWCRTTSQKARNLFTKIRGSQLFWNCMFFCGQLVFIDSHFNVLDYDIKMTQVVISILDEC